LSRILEIERERKHIASEKAIFIDKKVTNGRSLAYGNIQSKAEEVFKKN